MKIYASLGYLISGIKKGRKFGREKTNDKQSRKPKQGDEEVTKKAPNPEGVKMAKAWR